MFPRYSTPGRSTKAAGSFQTIPNAFTMKQDISSKTKSGFSDLASERISAFVTSRCDTLLIGLLTMEHQKSLGKNEVVHLVNETRDTILHGIALELEDRKEREPKFDPQLEVIRRINNDLNFLLDEVNIFEKLCRMSCQPDSHITRDQIVTLGLRYTDNAKRVHRLIQGMIVELDPEKARHSASPLSFHQPKEFNVCVTSPDLLPALTESSSYTNRYDTRRSTQTPSKPERILYSRVKSAERMIANRHLDENHKSLRTLEDLEGLRQNNYSQEEVRNMIRRHDNEVRFLKIALKSSVQKKIGTFMCSLREKFDEMSQTIKRLEGMLTKCDKRLRLLSIEFHEERQALRKLGEVQVKKRQLEIYVQKHSSDLKIEEVNELRDFIAFLDEENKSLLKKLQLPSFSCSDDYLPPPLSVTDSNLENEFPLPPSPEPQSDDNNIVHIYDTLARQKEEIQAVQDEIKMKEEHSATLQAIIVDLETKVMESRIKNSALEQQILLLQEDLRMSQAKLTEENRIVDNIRKENSELQHQLIQIGAELSSQKLNAKSWAAKADDAENRISELISKEAMTSKNMENRIREANSKINEYELKIQSLLQQPSFGSPSHFVSPTFQAVNKLECEESDARRSKGVQLAHATTQVSYEFVDPRIAELQIEIGNKDQALRQELAKAYLLQKKYDNVDKSATNLRVENAELRTHLRQSQNDYTNAQTQLDQIRVELGRIQSKYVLPFDDVGMESNLSLVSLLGIIFASLEKTFRISKAEAEKFEKECKNLGDKLFESNKMIIDRESKVQSLLQLEKASVNPPLSFVSPTQQTCIKPQTAEFEVQVGLISQRTDAATQSSIDYVDPRSTMLEAEISNKDQALRQELAKSYLLEKKYSNVEKSAIDLRLENSELRNTLQEGQNRWKNLETQLEKIRVDCVGIKTKLGLPIEIESERDSRIASFLPAIFTELEERIETSAQQRATIEKEVESLRKELIEAQNKIVGYESKVQNLMQQLSLSSPSMMASPTFQTVIRLQSVDSEVQAIGKESPLIDVETQTHLESIYPQITELQNEIGNKDQALRQEMAKAYLLQKKYDNAEKSATNLRVENTELMNNLKQSQGRYEKLQEQFNIIHGELTKLKIKYSVQIDSHNEIEIPSLLQMVISHLEEKTVKASTEKAIIEKELTQKLNSMISTHSKLIERKLQVEALEEQHKKALDLSKHRELENQRLISSFQQQVASLEEQNKNLSEFSKLENPLLQSQLATLQQRFAKMEEEHRKDLELGEQRELELQKQIKYYQEQVPPLTLQTPPRPIADQSDAATNTSYIQMDTDKCQENKFVKYLSGVMKQRIDSLMAKETWSEFVVEFPEFLFDVIDTVDAENVTGGGTSLVHELQQLKDAYLTSQQVQGQFQGQYAVDPQENFHPAEKFPKMHCSNFFSEPGVREEDLNFKSQHQRRLSLHCGDVVIEDDVPPSLNHAQFISETINEETPQKLGDVLREAFEMKIKELEDLLALKEAKIFELSEKLEGTGSSSSIRKRANRENVPAAIAKLTAEKNELEDLMAEMTKKLTALTNEKEEMSNELDKLTEEKKELETDSELLQHQLQLKNDEIRSMHARMTELKAFEEKGILRNMFSKFMDAFFANKWVEAEPLLTVILNICEFKDEDKRKIIEAFRREAAKKAGFNWFG